MRDEVKEARKALVQELREKLHTVERAMLEDGVLAGSTTGRAFYALRALIVTWFHSGEPQ